MSEPLENLSSALAEALQDPDRLPTDIMVRGQVYRLKRWMGGGYKGAVWKATDELGEDVALKFAVAGDYVDRSYLQEVQRARKLTRYPVFARLDTAEEIALPVSGHGDVQFVCFVEEFIPGRTLAEILATEPELVGPTFVTNFVRLAAEALSALQATKLCHDDLHSKNIILEPPPEGTLDPEHRLRIVDMGSLKPAGSSTKPIDDHGHVVRHLCTLHDAMVRRKLLTPRERRYLPSLRSLCIQMVDEDPTMRLHAPELIRREFEQADQRSQRAEGARSAPLNSPFEYISAEHMADDELLVEIFADRCPWLDRVNGPDPCLLVGPRGCGKSTIFRWLSLRAHLHKPSATLSQLNVWGFYLSCGADLQNRLGWIRTEALAQRFEAELVHYFNMTLAREVIDTMQRVAERADAESFFGLASPAVRTIHEFVAAHLPDTRPTLGGAPLLRQTLEAIEAELFRCHSEMIQRKPFTVTTDAAFLGDLTTTLMSEVSSMNDKKIAFLLDDFSTHRLSSAVQVILNRIVWERRSSHVFKLSSEKYGAVLSDSFAATADITREMEVIDCGRDYIALDEKGQREGAKRFATQLLANRLRAAGYDGTPEQLIGESSWPEGSLAAELRAPRAGRSDEQYHGLRCIADLCSGDVATLLMIYRRIFDAGAVGPASKDPVAKHIQHRAITTVSRELTEAIADHHPFGPQMHALVTEFGGLVRRVLREGNLTSRGKQDDGSPNLVIPQCSRIEVDRTSDMHRPLSESVTELQRELVRRAVFIEMTPGGSRREVTTLRWQLRRVFLPTFRATPYKTEAFKWTPEQFRFFLTNPESACAHEWAKRQPDRDPGFEQTSLDEL